MSVTEILNQQRGGGMKKVLLLTFVLMVVASMAFAQAGRVGIYNSPTPGSVDDCGITDAAPGLVSVYLVQRGTGGSTAVQFAAPVPGCFTGQWLSDTAVWPVSVGNSQVGVGVGFGTCQTGDVHVLTVNIFAQGTTPTCCGWGVVPDPREEPPVLVYTDCDFELLPILGQPGVINGDATCTCSSLTAVEDTSWGQIKALYQND